MTRKIQNAAISCLKSDGQNERNGVIEALWKSWAYKNVNCIPLLLHLLTGSCTQYVLHVRQIITVQQFKIFFVTQDFLVNRKERTFQSTKIIMSQNGRKILKFSRFALFSNGDPIQPGARYKSIHSTLCHSEERTRKNTENPNSFELAVVLTIMMLVGFFMLALALKSACLSSDMSKNYFSSNPNYCPDSSQDQVLGHVE